LVIVQTPAETIVHACADRKHLHWHPVTLTTLHVGNFFDRQSAPAPAHACNFANRANRTIGGDQWGAAGHRSGGHDKQRWSAHGSRGRSQPAREAL